MAKKKVKTKAVKFNIPIEFLDDREITLFYLVDEFLNRSDEVTKHRIITYFSSKFNDLASKL